MNAHSENTAPSILLVEDEAHLAFNLQLNLREEGYEVLHVPRGDWAVDAFLKNGPFSLVLLDVMLPEMNGFEVARKIRTHDPLIGILMLTARAQEKDRIEGFQAGVDDYITKPFHLEELLLRVKRMLKRSEHLRGSTAPLSGTAHAEPPSLLSYKGLDLDVDNLLLKLPGGETKQLTLLETELFALFIQNQGQVFKREELLKLVWKMDGDIESRTVDNFIMRLRRYIEDNPSSPTSLVSVRGRGYRLNEITQPAF